MSQISKRILNTRLEERILDLFINAIMGLQTPLEVKNFIEDFFSPTEKIMMIKRLAIAILLSKGHTYEQIDHTLKVSKPTIMKVSHHLRNGTGGYQKVIGKIAQSTKREKLLDQIEELFLKLSIPKTYGSPAFQRKQKLGKELFTRKLKRSLI